MSADSNKKTEFVKTALDRFKICVDSTKDIRSAYLDDLKFLNGVQWSEEILQERTREKRPALTINKLPAIHNIIVNDFRQNRPAIKFRPVDNDTDPDKADVLNGLLRRIQNNGDSRSALDTAFFYAVAGGFGFVRVVVDYASDNTFDQDVYLEKIDNPCSVYFPLELCKTSDYSDAPYCFVREKISLDDFKERYPSAEVSQFNKSGEGDSIELWQTDEGCVYICEYFYVEPRKEYLVLLSNGDFVNVEESPEIGEMLPNTDLVVENVREINRNVIKRAVINECEILEEPVDFPGNYIPIVPMLAQEINVEGHKEYISLIRYAKDPQKMFNFWNSAFTEQVALAPKSPWLVAAGQIEGFEKYWNAANTKNLAYLPYHPVSAAGVPIPPPIRTQPPAVGSAIITGIQYASDNLKATTNIFDASLGARSNETSGKAILARQRQGSTANYHFTDNASRCLRHIGRIIKDLIPIVYDSPDRVVRIIGEDMSDKVFTLNRSYPDKKGNLYNMTVGEYDIFVDTGASYETKRIEMTETLTALSQSVPVFGQIAPDILVQALDFTGRDELSKRMKRYLKIQMPDLIDDDSEDEDEQEKIIQQSQQQIQQLGTQLQQAQEQLSVDQQQMQAMNEAIQKMSATIQNLQIVTKNKEADLAVKVQIEQMKADLEIMKMQAEIKQTLITEQNKRDLKKMDIGGTLAAQAQSKALKLNPNANIKKTEIEIE